MQDRPLVAVISGSVNDRETIEPVLESFRSFPVRLEYYVASAHRSPEKLKDLVSSLEARGVKVIIGVAGLSAHLPGVLASMTLIPVYGVPLSVSDLNGVESLYSMVMMPGGIPVASFGIGTAGLKNAILMACAHLGWDDADVKDRLTQERAKLADQVFVGRPAWTNQS